MGALPPECGKSPRVLVIGSYPSPLSLQRREYYANPRNQFWKIIEALFSIPSSVSYERRLSALTENGVALWDIVGACERKGAGDHSIRHARLNDIGCCIDRHPSVVRIVANGRAAGRYYRKKYPDGITGTCFRVLPSTSPAHAAMNLEQKTAAWRIIRMLPSGNISD
jgi:double-stranded uracil-DNA glycosylase